MKVDWVKTLGLIFSTLLALVLVSILLRERFAFLWVPTKLVGQNVGFVLNTYLLLDLVAITFVLFTAVACCVVMLAPLKKEGEE